MPSPACLSPVGLHPGFTECAQPAFAPGLFLALTGQQLSHRWCSSFSSHYWAPEAPLSPLAAPLSPTVPLVSDPNLGSQPKPLEPHPVVMCGGETWLSSGCVVLPSDIPCFGSLMIHAGHVPSKIAIEAQIASLNIRRQMFPQTQKL